MNELAFSEQTDVTSTPDAAPQREGLLASAYRLMTAPFTVRTPRTSQLGLGKENLAQSNW